MLSSNPVYIALVEEYESAHGEELKLVWTMDQPGQVLAALDHDPDLFVLDMHFGMKAFEAGLLLQDAGITHIICLFDRQDDPLIAVAQCLAFIVLLRATPKQDILGMLQIHP
jgi:hypothetical protein